MKLSALVLLALLGLPSAILQVNVSLEWVTWTGSVPNGAVAFYISYVKRTDYVCKYECNAGLYHPNLGPYCYYAYGGKEYKGSGFEILVNKDNFEFLEWKEGSWGSVPERSVRTCAGDDVYVGKNKYGLGKVHTRHEALFLPWMGKEYWYTSYEVLTYKAAYSQRISDVRYFIDEAEIFKHPPETMSTSRVTNNGCQNVIKTVTLSKTTEMQNTWNIGHSTTLGVKTSINAGIPLIASGNIEFTAQKTMQFNEGTTRVEAHEDSLSVQLPVPPNHSCNVRMEGRKITSDIPYTARVTRTYRDGQTHWTSIAGKYSGVQFGEVRSVIDRCEPVAYSKPCP